MKNDSFNDAVDETQSMDDSWSIMDHEVPALKESFRCLQTEIGANIEATKNTHVCFTLTARRLPEQERAAVDIMVALDVSGSMNGRKLSLCQRTLQQLMRLLSSEDRFGLVTFASASRLELPLRKMTAENKALALSKITALRTRDATNISSAIGLAFQELRAVDGPNTIQTVFLLTDGMANAGITSGLALEDLTKNCAVGGAMHMDRDGFEAPIQPPLPPISMHCFGYGNDHDGALLSTLSAAASGSYYYIQDDTGVDGAFGDALGGVLSLVAQNVVATFRLDPIAKAQGASIVNIHHDQVVARENGCFSVNVGDFYAEEVRDILIELLLEAIPPPQALAVPHLIASVGYLDVSRKIPIQGQDKTASIYRPEGSECSEQDEYVAVQLIRVSTTEALDRAHAQAEQGDIESARATISTAQSYISAYPSGIRSFPMIAQLVSDLTVALTGLASNISYTQQGSKLLAKQRRTHRMQRCSEVTFEDQTSNVYKTSCKGIWMQRMIQPPKADP